MISLSFKAISLKERLKYLFIFMPVYLATGVLYNVIGNYTSSKTYYTLSISIDEKIPFIPQFEFIYCILYILPIIPIFLINDSKHLLMGFVSYLIANFIAFSVFIIYPVYCPKPILDLNTISGYSLSIEHSLDTPMNSFPSLHAATSLLVFLLCKKINPVITLVLFFISLSIGASAVLIKQHYFLDIVAGYFLALLSYWITLSILNYKYSVNGT